MRKIWTGIFTIGAVALGMLAGPATAAPQEQYWRQEIERALAQAERALAQAELNMRAQLAGQQAQAAAQVRVAQAQLARQSAQIAAQVERSVARAQERAQERFVLFSDEEGGWLGVSIHEVAPEKAKELKLTPERGVLLTEVEENSPAAKAGLKANDVVLEMNGQRVEGTVQFRRIVRETPAGRTVELTIWRDARSQKISVQLGSRRDRLESRARVFGPRDFDFNIQIPNIMPEIVIGSRTPLLGVSVEDLSGQLGEYFGVPEGKGVLIREVNAGSPAAKAGLKAGDVIVKFDGDRIRDTGELRAKLREKREQKSVRLDVVRKGAELSINVEIEQPRPPERARITRRAIL